MLRAQHVIHQNGYKKHNNDNVKKQKFVKCVAFKMSYYYIICDYY